MYVFFILPTINKIMWCLHYFWISLQCQDLNPLYKPRNNSYGVNTIFPYASYNETQVPKFEEKSLVMKIKL